MPVRVGQEVQALPWGDRVASRVALRVDDRALARPLGGTSRGHRRSAWADGFLFWG